MELVKLSNSEVKPLFKDDHAKEDEVILGRGPILEISDVKLSRKVAKIRRVRKNKDDLSYVLLRAAKKPVFVSSQGDDYDMREVRQEDEVELHDGQRIALAPGRTEHVYTVRLTGNGLDTEEVVKGEKEKNPVKASPTKNGKRTLPSWMMVNADEDDEPKVKTPGRKKDDKLPIKRSSPKAPPSPKSPSPTPKKTTPKKASPSPRRSPLPKRLHAMSDDESGDEDNEKKSPKSSPASKKRKTTPKSTPDKKPGAHYISGSEEEEEEEKVAKKSPKKNKFPVLVTKDDFKSDDEEKEKEENLEKDLKATATKNTEEPKRKMCPYGASCYRKNPQHRLEESHPGDDDYQSDDEDNDEDDADDKRPECEYGVNCYRKNPQHRKDYKHTTKPNPKRRAKTKAANNKKKKSDYDSGDEDDEYEDSFIDDESLADISNDEVSEEEWVPTDDDD